MIAQRWLALILFTALVPAGKTQQSKKAQERPSMLPDKKLVLKLKQNYGDLVTRDWLKGVTAASTTVGDIATGALVDEDKDKSLTLDTRPCKGHTVTFHH